MLHFGPYRIEVVTMAVAIAEYAAYRAGLELLIWVSVPAAVVIQRYFTRGELQEAAAVGARPMGRDAWIHIAKVLVDSSDAIAVVLIETTDVAAARMVVTLQGGCDAVGLVSPKCIAVLLLDCPPALADAYGRRLRAKLRLNRIPCQVAVAAKPRDGQLVEGLLTVCEAELVVRSEASRRSANSS
jgi:hypothetical protein